MRVLLPGLLTTAIVWLGAVFVAAGELSGGLLVAFYGFAVFLAEQLRRATTMIDQLTRGVVAARRVVDFLSLTPQWEPPAVATPVATDTAAGEALTDPESGISVPPDCFLGAVCTSMMEADELAHRLAWYTDSDTRVTYGGVPLSRFSRAHLRRRILLVTGASSLFSGTLRTELDPYGRATEDETLLWRAIDDASARDIIDGLPHGLDTEIGGAGRDFSGGQQQRLRLVRALMADPQVLILVEPTNALDAHTEARVAHRLKAHRAGRPTVVFTTSPILLDHADQVLLVDGGTVVTAGRHETLRHDPRYRAVVSREVAGV